MSFGNGSDGDVVLTTDTTLTRDMNYNNLTIDAGVTLNPDGYIIYVLNTLTLNGTISRNGNPGLGYDCAYGDGWDACWSLGGGPALPTNSVGGSGAGGAGGDEGWDWAHGFTCNNGIAGSNVEGIADTNGGAGGDANCSGASGGVTTVSHTVCCDDIEDVIVSAATRMGGPGGGGGGGDYSTMCAGGAGGSGGGVIYISAKTVTGEGVISANGGNGSSCGSAAGGGGGGGAAIIEYKYKDDFTGDVTVNGGTGYQSGTAGTIIYCMVNVSPVANCNGPYSGVVDMTIPFDGSSSSDSDGTIVNWDWDFGDGGTGSGETTTHTYLEAGAYNVTLTVTDDQAATDDAICVCVIEAVPDYMMLGGDIGKRKRRGRPSPEV